MLTIYGSDLSAPAIKVRLTASWMGIEHKWQLVNLREGEQKNEWFLKINPVGKVPAIDDDGFHLSESNAICTAGQSITLADIVLFAMLEPVEMANFSLSPYPRLGAWRNELKKQPFYTKCYKEYGEMLKK